MRPWLARLSLWINENTGGEKGQYLCARLAERYGAYSWPRRALDMICMEEGHCRRQLFWDRYQKP